MPALDDPHDVVGRAERGAPTSPQGRRSASRRRYRLDPACCSTCSGDLEGLRRLRGVEDVQRFDSAGIVIVTADDEVSDEAIRQAAAAGGVTLAAALPAGADAARRWWRRPDLLALAGAALLLGIGLAVEHLAHDVPASQALYVAAVVVGGAYPLRQALVTLRARRVTIGVLLVVATAGALALGHLDEAAELVVVFSLGEVLEGYAADRARGSIRALMALAPPEAVRRRDDGSGEVVPVEALAPGDVVLARPGERVPTDGRVRSGASWVDQSPVTGESMPIKVGPGAQVFGGTINGPGALEITVASPYADTVLARVIRQVEEAQAHRGRAQRFADRFGALYTPIMFALAFVVAVLGPSFGLGWRAAIYRGLVVLSVSCSCALVISVPVTVVTSIARAARDGILIKGGAYLEALARIDTVAFDKTGTLTEGRPALVRTVALDGLDADHLLALAAGVESSSEHPLGRAVLDAARQRGLDVPAARDARARPGVGIVATVEGRRLRVGRLDPAHPGAEAAQVALAELESAGVTAVAVADDAQVLGLLGIADAARPEAAGAIGALRDLGMRHLVMLTGDNRRVAAALSAQLGLDEYRAGLLPEDKTAAIEQLRATQRTVAMVGDGVNDAPALASADVAVAMGAAGTDVALETADVALMADDLARLPAALRLARRAQRNIRQNVVMSLASVALLVAAALAGLLNLTAGVVLNEGTAVLIIANGLRMLRRPAGEDQPQ